MNNYEYLVQLPGSAQPDHRTTQDLRVVDSGGLVRFQAPSPVAIPAQQDFVGTRVHTGTTRFGGIGVAESVAFASHQTPITGTVNGSVVATLQSGSRASVELIPGDPTSRTLVAVAEREGLIRLNDAGRWEDIQKLQGQPAVAQASQQGPEETTDQTTDAEASMGAFCPSLAADWAADIADLPQGAFDSAQSSMIGVIALGSGSLEDTAMSLARNVPGMSPELAREHIDGGLYVHQQAADKAMSQIVGGHELEAMYAAFRDQPQKLMPAIQALALSHDMRPLKAMAIEWKARNTDVSIYEKMGMQASVDRTTGDVLVQRGTGPWMKASDVWANASKIADSDAATAAVSKATAAAPLLGFNVSRMSDTEVTNVLRAAGFELLALMNGSTMARRGDGEWYESRTLLAKL